MSHSGTGWSCGSFTTLILCSTWHSRPSAEGQHSWEWLPKCSWTMGKLLTGENPVSAILDMLSVLGCSLRVLVHRTALPSLPWDHHPQPKDPEAAFQLSSGPSATAWAKLELCWSPALSQPGHCLPRDPADPNPMDWDPAWLHWSLLSKDLLGPSHFKHG